MSRDTSTALTADIPPAIRPAALRSGLALAVLAAMAAFAVRAQAQQGPSPAALDDLRHVVSSNPQTNSLGSGAIGLLQAESDGRVGLRIEARDDVTVFDGLRGELRDRKARNDLQFTAGLTFDF